MGGNSNAFLMKLKNSIKNQISNVSIYERIKKIAGFRKSVDFNRLESEIKEGVD